MSGAPFDPTAAAPVIVRVAGQPADVVSGSDLGWRIEQARRMEERLATARQELLDRLYQAIHDAPAERRRFLLTVKRDCYNQRPLARHRGAEGWSVVEAVDRELVARVLDLEAALAEWRRDFETAYAAAARDEIAALVRLLDDRLFACGLAIASPLVARQCRRLLVTPPEAFGRRERKLVPTLLRYASRAALKLSPFSTFTPVGLASIRAPGADPAADDPAADGSAAVRLLADGWRETSLLRIRRYLLDQYWEMLHRFAPLREHLRVTLNDSRAGGGAERSVFLRPAHWRPEEAGMEHVEESLVRGRLDGPLIEHLEAALGVTRPVSECPTWRRLVDDLVTRLAAGEADVAGQVDRLIDVGFLHLLPPWSTDEPHLEKAMLRELGRLPVAARLEPFLAPLARLVDLEDGILASSDPGRDLDEIGRLTDALLHAAARLAGWEVAGGRDEQRYRLYQDVFRRPAAVRCPPEELQSLAAVRREAAEDAVRSVEPLARYTRLFDHRQDFLATLGAVLGRRSPGRSSFGLFTAFEAVQDHWQDYVKFVVDARGSDRWGSTWNPLGLDELSDLDRFRRRARVEIERCLHDRPEGRRIDGGALDALLDRAPRGAASAPGGSCLFVQPAAADGSLWVLNRLKEGTGRFASRYTSAMSDSERRCYTADLAARAVFELDGEPAELLDIQCIQGDTLNVHARQTPRLLTLPGAASELPAARRRSLRDLVVTLGEDGRPQLRDRDGQRYLAAHLGGGYQDYMPTVVKFLSLFGPSEMGAVFPPPWTRRQGSLVISERTLIGNVVIHRKSWTAATADLRSLVERLADAEALERLNRWRLEHGIPERVFLREAVPHPYAGRRYRPQYLDFTSPGLTTICRSAIESDARSITLVEMLPGPEAFPRDAAGRAWAVELLLDSLALAPPSWAPSRHEPPAEWTALPHREWWWGEPEPSPARQ